jgi:hypothetical protein
LTETTPLQSWLSNPAKSPRPLPSRDRQEAVFPKTVKHPTHARITDTPPTVIESGWLRGCDHAVRLPVLGGLLTLFARVLIAASPVGVYLDFEAPPSEAAVAAMRKETATILDRVDIQIAWRQVSENQGNEPFERLAVVKFTGKCACGGFLPATREILVLGTTAVVDGRVLPYSEVRCDAIRRVLPDIEYASERRLGDAALGRVLGRVLAHELYHVVRGTVHHGASGLAKGFQSTVDLKSDELAFDRSDWESPPPAK